MSYEKQPDYACDECHRSFKNKRALKMHTRDLHQPVQTNTNRLVERVDHSDAVRRRSSCSDGAQIDD